MAGNPREVDFTFNPKGLHTHRGAKLFWILKEGPVGRAYELERGTQANATESILREIFKIASDPDLE